MLYKKYLTISAVLLAGCYFSGALTTSTKAATMLDGNGILEALVGNSVLHPSFGCVFYKDEQTAILHSSSGQISEYYWRIEGSKYYSNGSCSELGCTINQGPDFIEFTRSDGQYYRKTLLVRGDICKNGALST